MTAERIGRRVRDRPLQHVPALVRSAVMSNNGRKDMGPEAIALLEVGAVICSVVALAWVVLGDD